MFAFSLQYVYDTNGHREDSGHYSMTVDQTNGETHMLAYPVEVSVYSGHHIAVVDVSYFFDEHDVLLTCGTVTKSECMQKAMGQNEVKRGHATFTVLKNHSEIHQKV